MRLAKYRLASDKIRLSYTETRVDIDRLDISIYVNYICLGILSETVNACLVVILVMVVQYA
jgi:hypothetical protein